MHLGSCCKALELAKTQRSHGFKYVLTLLVALCQVIETRRLAGAVSAERGLEEALVAGLLSQPCVVTGTWNTVIVMRIEF